jgi:hypothetical protein
MSKRIRYLISSILTAVGFYFFISLPYDSHYYGLSVGVVLVAFCFWFGLGIIFDFARIMRSLRPDWCVVICNSDGKKQEIIKLADGGAKKPPKNTKLGKCLSNYTSPSNDAYDKDFDELIRSKRPDWYDRTYLKKQELIALADSGADKPHWKSKPGKCLYGYMQRDKAFAQIMMTKRPDWF